MGSFPSDPYRRNAANRDVEEEALGWVVRLTSGEVTADERREFNDWHADSENARNYVLAQRLWSGVGPVLSEKDAQGWPEPEPLQEPDAHASSFSQTRRYLRGLAAAGMVGLTTLLAVQYVQIWQYDRVSGSAIARNIALHDGSHLTMGPGTAVKLDFTGGARHVSLARGEAYFDVSHDAAHPFVVSSGNGLVRVLGTAFSVRRQENGAVKVTVARGRVRVTSGARSVVMLPDRQVSYDASGLSRVRAVDAAFDMAWMRGRLIMKNRPMTEVLAELDRYRDGKIILLNQEAGQRRINAVINLDHTDSWLTALAASEGLVLNTAGPVSILR